MDVAYFIERARGISVIHLIMTYTGDSGKTLYHSPLDYHLHVLFYFDRELKHAGAINLDSGQLLTMSWEDEARLYLPLRDLTKDLARAWVGQVSSLIKANAPFEKWKDTAFSGAEPELIRKFDELKEKTFSNDLKRFSVFSESKEIESEDQRIPLEETRDPDEILENAKIFIVENRLVPV